jgi:hypothetical protein
MIIKNLTWHQKVDGEKTSEWLGLPAREYVKEDGSKGYANIIDFTDKKLYFNFVEAVLEALKLGEAWRGDEAPQEEVEDIPF